MEWLTFDEALAWHSGWEPQAVSLFADIPALHRQIAIPPRRIPPSDGPPGFLDSWYGRIGSRPIVIECDVDTSSPGIVLRTPFVDSSPRGGDWKILLELRGLPDSIQATKPWFIQSRAVSRDHVVYRSNPHGWKEPLYAADSRDEAAALIDYLKRDPWNQSCFIAAGEKDGEWGIIKWVDATERVVGAYPDIDRSLRVACQFSQRDASAFKIRDLSGEDPRVYIVEGGRVTETG